MAYSGQRYNVLVAPITLEGGQRYGSLAQQVISARQQLSNKIKREPRGETDAFYAAYLSLRSEPFTAFLSSAPSKWALPISSVNEDRLLRELGLSAAERNRIEGLQ